MLSEFNHCPFHFWHTAGHTAIFSKFREIWKTIINSQPLCPSASGHGLKKLRETILSILHYAKESMNQWSQGLWSPKWGTVGSGVTPGLRPDGRTPEIPENSTKIPEKPKSSGKSMNLHVTYQMKALGKQVHVDTVKSQNSRKCQENSGNT